VLAETKVRPPRTTSGVSQEAKRLAFALFKQGGNRLEQYNPNDDRSTNVKMSDYDDMQKDRMLDKWKTPTSSSSSISPFPSYFFFPYLSLTAPAEASIEVPREQDMSTLFASVNESKKFLKIKLNMRGALLDGLFNFVAPDAEDDEELETYKAFLLQDIDHVLDNLFSLYTIDTYEVPCVHGNYCMCHGGCQRFMCIVHDEWASICAVCREASLIDIQRKKSSPKVDTEVFHYYYNNHRCHTRMMRPQIRPTI